MNTFQSTQRLSGNCWRRYSYHAVRLGLGAIFVVASYDKILKPQAFALAVYQYQILPDSLVNLVALILPWLELLIGLCLIANIWVPGAAALSCALMIVFTASLVYTRMRGLDIHCGCFSTDVSEGPADRWTILRDVVFLGMALYLVAGVFLRRWPHTVFERSVRNESDTRRLATGLSAEDTQQ